MSSACCASYWRQRNQISLAFLVPTRSRRSDAPKPPSNEPTRGPVWPKRALSAAIVRSQHEVQHVAAADRVAGDHRDDRLGQPADLDVQVGDVEAPDAARRLATRSPCRRARAGRRRSRRPAAPSPVRMITPTAGSSRASSSASRHLDRPSAGRNALRTSGRSIVIFAMPSPLSLVADVLEVAAAGVPRHCHAARQATFRPRARRVLAARAPPRARPERPRACNGAHATPSCSTRADGVAARALPRRGVGPGDRVAIALPPGEDFASRCTPCCGSARSPCPSTCGCTRPSAARSRGRATSSSTRRSAIARPAPTSSWPSSTTSTRPRSSSTPRARAARPRPIELTYGNWLWSALGSAVALGARPRGALAVHAAARARRRAVDPDAQRDLRDDGDRPRALRRRPRAATRCMDPDGPTLVSLVPTTLAAPARRRAAHAAARCAGRCSAARRSRPRCWARAAAAGVPVAATYGLTEACSQVTTDGAPLFCTRVAPGRRRRDPRLRARPSPRRRRASWHTGDLGEFDGRRRAAHRRAQGRHDHHRRRERRARRGRGGARGAPGGRRGGGARRPTTPSGARRSSRPSCARRRRRARTSSYALVRGPARALQGPQGVLVRRRRSRARHRASCCVEACDDAPSPDDYRAAEPRPLGAVGRRLGEAPRGLPAACALPLSQWMVEAIAPQPGHRVLELAAGLRRHRPAGRRARAARAARC